MKTIKYLLLLMLIPVLGVVVFQSYWIVNTYNINEERFKKDAKSALLQAIQEDLVYNTKDKFEEIDGSSVTLSPNATLNKGQELDELLKILGSGDSIPTEDITVHITGTDSIRAGMLPKSIGNLKDTTIIVGASKGFDLTESTWQDMISRVVAELVGHQYQLESIDSLFKKNLKERDIETSYKLALFQGEEFLEATSTDTTGIYDPDIVTKFGKLYSEGAEIKVLLPEKTSFLLWQMWLTLSTSFVLVLLLILSFVYMLTVILRQKKLSEMKNDFISNMTHELKTPISTVSAAVEAMQNFGVLDDREKTDKYLKISGHELKRLNTMVEKVLNISAYEKDKVNLNKEVVNLTQLIGDTVERYRVRQDLELTIINECNEQLLINADKMHIQNLLNNLLDNAIKYCDRVPVIYVKCRRIEGIAQFSVKDNGIGISKENQKHIFEKFYRVPSDHMHQVKGFGLGLSYVKHVVDRHDGTVSLSSRPGQGSEFIVQIPISHG